MCKTQSFAHSLTNFAVKKKEFNRKDAKKCKVRKVQFHAVYSIDYVSHKGTKDTKGFTAVEETAW